MFAALRLYASDKVRTLPTRAGIEGLGHKSRHSLTDAIEAGNTGRAPEELLHYRPEIFQKLPGVR
jgi:hypothetical protein